LIAFRNLRGTEENLNKVETGDAFTGLNL